MMGLEEPRLVGLLDGQGRTLVLGVIREVDGEKKDRQWGRPRPPLKVWRT